MLHRAAWIAGTLLTAAVCFATWAHQALPFLWALLPADSAVHVALDRTASGTSIIEGLLGYLSTTGLEPTPLSFPVPELMPRLNRFAVAQGPDGAVLVVLPQPRQQAAVRQALQSDGWRVERIGLLLRASRPHRPIPPVSSAIASAVRDAGRSSMPLFPIAQAAIAATPGQAAVHLVAVADQREIRLYASQTNTMAEGLTLPTAAAKGNTFQLPGPVFSLLPAPLQRDWEAQLREKFGFTHTKPAILSELAAQKTVTVQWERNSLTITVAGDPDHFSQTVESWIQAEDAQRHPQQQSFRLPDGTRGRELIPGPIRPVFTQAGSCREGLPDRLALWVCNGEASAALSTERALAQAAAAGQPMPGWLIQLEADSTPLGTVLPGTVIAAAGSETAAIIRLLLP